MRRESLIWILLAACTAATMTSWIDSLWVPRLSATLLLTATCLWLAFSGSRRHRTIDRAVWLLLAIPAWGAAQFALGVTVYRNATLLAIVYWTSLAGVFWMSAETFSDKRRRHRMLSGFATLAAVLACVALLQPYAGRLGVPGMRSVAADAYAATFANRNMYACFAELALPVLVWLGLWNGPRRWHCLLCAAAVAASALTTGSRGGALFILIECVVLAAFAARGQNLQWKLTSASAVILVTVLAATLGDGALVTRVQYSDPMVFRKQIYQSGIAMFADRPLTGFGLGTFSAAYPAYALFDNGRFVNLAHNDWLQLSVEGGVFALALIIAFCAQLLPGLRRSPWALGVPIVLLHAFVDFPLHRAGVAAWWMVLAGALRAKQLSRRAEPILVPLSVESSDRSLATAVR